MPAMRACMTKVWLYDWVMRHESESAIAWERRLCIINFLYHYYDCLPELLQNRQLHGRWYEHEVNV